MVDDVPSNRDLIAGYFYETSHQILFARDGLEAIRITKSHHPDLIFLDLRMPRMDGRETVKFLKQDEETKDIPIVILTALSKVENENKLNSLCEGFARKPISCAELIAEIKKIFPITSDTISSQPEPVVLDNSSETNIITTKSIDGKPIRLNELLDKLSQEKEESWQNFRQTLAIGDIEKFIGRLSNWGEEYECQLLLEYASNLNQQIDEFDWDEIPKTVDHFTGICDDLRNMI
ncbi:MAG: response regulator [Microcoleaceae cyanobacterium MO_207.B10]|nr:response regulator [Microcoleaceae cyanobacterium MO_207.B10]